MELVLPKKFLKKLKKFKGQDAPWEVKGHKGAWCPKGTAPF
jgi:hypothetical protein